MPRGTWVPLCGGVNQRSLWKCIKKANLQGCKQLCSRVEKKESFLNGFVKAEPSGPISTAQIFPAGPTSDCARKSELRNKSTAYEAFD
ncbi:hypothetical protein E5288_WYG002956 [Bos mutus]|uniref:Uncharacterized protein n=1 Tax=Bos mutus TaxID=72004 RepID=A0A6B0S9S4_9CETA|nr:hypothetical protein [Bos mutus]